MIFLLPDDPASEVIMLSTLPTGGGAFVENLFYPSAQRGACIRNPRPDWE